MLEKVVWNGAVWGIVLKYHPWLLTSMYISGLHFDMYNVILENYIIHGLSLKCYGMLKITGYIFIEVLTTQTVLIIFSLISFIKLYCSK